MQIKKIKVGNKDIEIREFLVEAIEEIFADPQLGIDIVTDMLIGRPQGEKKLLVKCTDLSEEEISKMGFGDYRRLVLAMREVNPDFFGIYQEKTERLAELAQIVAQRGKSAIPEPSTGLSGKGTKAP